MKSFIKYKICSLFRKISFSATILNSKIDVNAVVRKNCRIYDSQIGRYTYVTRNCLIQNTTIGNFCSISEGCYIGMPSHPLKYFSTSPVFFKGRNYFNKNLQRIDYCESYPVNIGNDVWIGVGVKIKDGIDIGDGAVIGAGSIVTKNIPSYEIWAGNPAHFIRKRFTQEREDLIRESCWWEKKDYELEKFKI